MDIILYKVVLLLASITTAMLNGVKHYTENGILLKTPLEVLKKLASGEEIVVDETERVERISTEKILKILLESSSSLQQEP